MEKMKRTWVTSGCSIVMDGWTDIRHRPLINIMVTSTAEPYFLSAIDCSGHSKDVHLQFQILKDAIQEVGPQNVVHIVTDAAQVCRTTRKMIEATYRHIWWTPCVHAMNKRTWVKSAGSKQLLLMLEMCRYLSATTILHMHSLGPSPRRNPIETRYASYFILLERMLELRKALQVMVMIAKWNR